jgi:hypothetical protein
MPLGTARSIEDARRLRGAQPVVVLGIEDPMVL